MRGGARPGAGRKKSGKHSAVFWVSDAEETLLRKHLESIRSKSSGTDIASFETVMEAKGQTVLSELVNPPTPTPASDISINAWQQTVRDNIDFALKKSKKHAAEALAAVLCNVMNEQILNCLDESINVKLDYAASLIPKVTDSRKKASTVNTLENFMFSHGYYKTPDTATNRQLWHKNDLLYNLIFRK